MLTSSFVHLPTIGPETERRLWRQGIRSWGDFLAAAKLAGLSARRGAELARHLAESVRALRAADHAYFAARLPRSEHWRAYPEFAGRIAYLDIETTGLGFPACVTVIGLHDGRRTRAYVHGDNMDEFPEDLGRYGLIVTFNGATFDLPFLRQRFPHLPFDQLHVDLRYALARLGLRGGLKAIEQHLLLGRSSRGAHLDGFDAVRLWQEYQAGCPESLELLLEYNRYDVENLPRLMEYAYQRLRRRCLEGLELQASRADAA